MALAQELLNLAGEAGTQIQAVWPDSQADRRLFWTAVNLGGALAAVGMIDKLETVDGLAELRAVLQVEPFDVLEAAAVGLAARSAVSAMDLCAAAAWRIKPAIELPNAREAHLAWLAKPKQRSQLLPDHEQWVDAVTGSDEWSLMLACRHQATHGTFRRMVQMSSGASRLPYDEFEVDGVMYPADDLVRRFAQNAESWFRQFCAIQYV